MANEFVTGTVIIKVDGASIRSKEGAKLEMGGFERTMQYADGAPIGFSSKPIGSKITATLAHTSSSNLTSIRDITDISLLFVTDSGVRFSILYAFCTKPPEITGVEGDVAVEFMGKAATEQGSSIL